MKLGIFGGTFDPPHIGHQILAAEARQQLGLERVLWVLTPTPPHKLGQDISPAEIRLELVQAAIQGEPGFELSRVDLDRPGPHYSVETVRLLRAQYPGAELFFLIGSDSLHDLPTWHTPQAFLEALDGLAVMQREQETVDLSLLEMLLPGLGPKLHFISAPLFQVASSEIRMRIRGGLPYRFFLPESVYKLILEKHYYQD
jgi:nicotinate-nucleotide adenylyltransferase